MKELYASVNVKQVNSNERAEYFITKENFLYGIEIVKTETVKQFENIGETNNSENQKRIEIKFDEISNNENTVKSIIDMFIAQNSDFEQMKYIISDCKENLKERV